MAVRLLGGEEGEKIDPTWMARLQNGDKEAFRRVVEQYRFPLFRLVMPIVGDPKEAEDVLQEAFVRIFLSLPGYRGEGFKTWISRIAVHQAIDWRRKAGRRREMPDHGGSLQMRLDRVSAADPPERQLLAAERERGFQERIGRLPPRYRRVVQAYYIEERSYQEIAAREGIAAKTVETRLYRAKQWMRLNWKEEPE